jgi:hypothetical protein
VKASLRTALAPGWKSRSYKHHARSQEGGDQVMKEVMYVPIDGRDLTNEKNTGSGGTLEYRGPAGSWLRDDATIIGKWEANQKGPAFDKCFDETAFCPVKFMVSQWNADAVSDKHDVASSRISYRPVDGGDGYTINAPAIEAAGGVDYTTIPNQDTGLHMASSWFEVDNRFNKFHVFQVNGEDCKDCLGTFTNHWGGAATGNTPHTGYRFGTGVRVLYRKKVQHSL